MDDIGFDVSEAILWFPHEQDTPFALVRVTAETALRWLDSLPPIVRRCYVVDDVLIEYADRRGKQREEIVATKLPDPGAVMSGDFGEIIAYLYQATVVHPARAIGAKKWRLKQDRRKPTPYSDVVHFVLPDWPNASANDQLMCSEVKSKATSGASEPIVEAIADVQKDVTSRLAKTLVWLRERAMTMDLGDVQIAHLDRFIHVSDHPPATRHFRAVAVVCDSLAAAELTTVPGTLPQGHTLVVIVVPRLKDTYAAIFQAAVLSV